MRIILSAVQLLTIKEKIMNYNLSCESDCGWVNQVFSSDVLISGRESLSAAPLSEAPALLLYKHPAPSSAWHTRGNVLLTERIFSKGLKCIIFKARWRKQESELRLILKCSFPSLTNWLWVQSSETELQLKLQITNDRNQQFNIRRFHSCLNHLTDDNQAQQIDKSLKNDSNG